MGINKRQPNYYQHKVGDGLHYVNNHFVAYADGSSKYGDSSVGCVLLHLSNICSVYQLPRLDILWTEVYPDEPKTLEDVAKIIGMGLRYTIAVNPRIPDNRADIIQDVKAIGCPELAEKVTILLAEKGILV